MSAATNWLQKYRESLEKARKDSPEYAVWLEKYRAKRNKANPDGQLNLFEGKKDPGYKKVLGKDLIAKPPKFVKDKDVWKQAVNKLTNNGEKPSSYGAAIMLYKRKLEKLAKQPAQLREDEVPWDKASEEIQKLCMAVAETFRNKRLAK
jgi:hypothetical protein